MIVGPKQSFFRPNIWSVYCTCCGVEDLFDSQEAAQAFVGDVDA